MIASRRNTSITNGGALSGQIAVIHRGTCAFESKVLNAAGVGALGVIIIDSQNLNESTAPIVTAADDNPVPIPALSVSFQDGNPLQQLVFDGKPVSVELTR